MRLRSILAASLAVSSCCACETARAADMAAPITFFTPSWPSFYVGATAGLASNRARAATSGLSAGTQADIASSAVPAALTLRTTEEIGALQAGLMWRAGAMAFGAEADLVAMNARKARAYLGVGSVASVYRAKLTSLAMARARLGYVMGQTLIYATAGLARGRVRHADSIFSAATIGPSLGATMGSDPWFDGARSRIKTGWSVGAGVEYALSEAVSVKAEYLYYNLGETRISVDPNPLAATVIPVGYAVRFKVDGQLARIGFNYRF